MCVYALTHQEIDEKWKNDINVNEESISFFFENPHIALHFYFYHIKLYVFTYKLEWFDLENIIDHLHNNITLAEWQSKKKNQHFACF